LRLKISQNSFVKTSGSKLFWVGFFLVLIDQVSKFLVKGNLDVGQSIVVFDWFLIYFVENNGFAFGYEFFGFWGKLFLTTVRLVFVVFIFRWMLVLIRNHADKWVLIGLLLVLSGAIGNIIDSVFYGPIYGYAPLFFGRVVDMFYFPLFSGTYPDWVPFFGGNDFVFFRFIFNLADSFITVGGFLLLFFNSRIPLK
tara:strand:+ start:3642 stop:4229 length:588 start_codon:yes stop_codon:yes gene_type:complete